MRNLPSAVKVLGKWMTINYVDELESYDDTITHGDFCEAESRIRIKKASPEWMYQVLIHEIGHAIFSRSAWSEVLGSNEEGVCKLIENFSSMLKIDPDSKLFKYDLCEKEAAGRLRTRRLAHKRVAYAVSKGKLVRPKRCPQCKKAGKVQAHHHNGYENALDIVWLCQKCHSAEHRSSNG
jgi:ribosomal protein S27AE